MTAWRRWQDYATIVFGVLLFISPFVFGETSQRVATLSAYVLGVLLFLSGIAAASNREDRQSPILNPPGIVAVITFIAPFVLGFTGVTGIAEASATRTPRPSSLGSLTRRRSAPTAAQSRGAGTTRSHTCTASPPTATPSGG